MANIEENQKKTSNSVIEAGAKGVSTDTLSGAVFEFFRFIGLFGMQSFQILVKSASEFHKKHLSRRFKKIDNTMLNAIKAISKAYKFVLFKMYMFFKFFVDAKNVVKNGYRSHPEVAFPIKLIYALSAFFKGVKNNRQIFVTAINYALPVITGIVFLNLVAYVSTLNFAVSVEYNGQQIGYIENETIFEQAENKLQERMIYTDTDEAIESFPKFTVAVVENEKLKSDAEMTDTIIQSSSGEIVKATGLSIDGEFYGAVKDGTLLTTTLASMKEAYKTNTPGEEVDFAREVKTEEGFYKAENVVETTSLTKQITSLEEKDVFYTVVSGDTPILIASKNDMSLDEIVAMNPDILENCKIGKQVQVKRAQAFLPVKVTRNETYNQAVAFTTTYTESSKLYKGTTRTAKAGVKGVQEVTAKVDYIDGTEVGRTVVSTVVTTEPVAAIVEKGTMALPAATINRGSGKSESGFQWPVAGGYISQYYGNYGHNGIDYAYRGNGYGQPIWASIPGTVTFAGSSGSYGKLVIVTSPGGIQTWYAHCSSLLVSQGDTVGQGQQIARVGSTGRSTGNHLHFRVLVNGVQKNPLNYLP